MPEKRGTTPEEEAEFATRVADVLKRLEAAVLPTDLESKVAMTALLQALMQVLAGTALHAGIPSLALIRILTRELERAESRAAQQMIESLIMAAVAAEMPMDSKAH